MTDQEVLQAAYEARLAKLYEVMFMSHVAASGNAAELAKADAAFKAGVEQARQVRDRAIALL